MPPSFRIPRVTLKCWFLYFTSYPEIPERDTMLFYLLWAASATGPGAPEGYQEAPVTRGTVSAYFLGH